MLQNVEVLHNAGVMTLLRPLLLDCVPNIQQTTSLALSRLANYSEELAEAIVHENILIQLVYSLKCVCSCAYNHLTKKFIKIKLCGKYFLIS